MARVPPTTPYNTLAGSESDSAETGAAFGSEETRTLLDRTPQPGSWLGKRLLAEVRRDRADTLLLACYVITGILDSASISTWSAFVSMQTGNTVCLGLGPTTGTNRWKKPGTSILAFYIGSFCFSRLHRVFSPPPRRKWIRCLSFSVQALFIIAAAAILTWGPKGADPDDIHWFFIVPIALIAFQTCGQAVISRALKYNALTSVVLTSIYCDLFRMLNCLGVSGAIIRGLFAKSELGTAGALWIVAALKLMIMLGWAVWPVEEP
ncbi:hypothetical protein FOQG_16969 [Fusarium oxysporum f. sp. raphani 54005]|uniref:DUF1275 domain protein n=1 Tax=Fusarium oxysporum f. sp. raphani 54005 TaxID=1089458 RepID=X0C6J3_FUSOX|nr:hypothetical protein FOQG_16969 [Fusarium oxysporum f. sp. raphani 54005]